MTNTYDTSNEPLGSTAVKVLYNNASNFDDALNAFVNTWVDRFGRNRQTWWGFEQSFNEFLINSGFEPNHLTYVDGSPLQVDRPTQLIDRAGSVYRVKMPASFPVMLTGNWVTDQNLLVDVGDASLRQDLNNSTDLSKGAAVVGRSIPTVKSVRVFSGDLPGELKGVQGRYDGDRIDVLAYWDDLPGVGAGQFRWDAASTATEVPGMVVSVTGATNGRWVRQYYGESVDPIWFGVRPGVVSTAALQAAFAFGKHIAYGAYHYVHDLSGGLTKLEGQCEYGAGGHRFTTPTSLLTKLECTASGGYWSKYSSISGAGQKSGPQIHNCYVLSDNGVSLGDMGTALSAQGLCMKPIVSGNIFQARTVASGRGLTMVGCFDWELMHNEFRQFDNHVLLIGCDIGDMHNNRTSFHGSFAILELSAAPNFGSQNKIRNNDILVGSLTTSVFIRSTSQHVRIYDNYLEQGQSQNMVKGFIDTSLQDIPTVIGNVNATSGIQQSVVVDDNRIDGHNMCSDYLYKINPGAAATKIWDSGASGGQTVAIAPWLALANGEIGLKVRFNIFNYSNWDISGGAGRFSQDFPQFKTTYPKAADGVFQITPESFACLEHGALGSGNAADFVRLSPKSFALLPGIGNTTWLHMVPEPADDIVNDLFRDAVTYTVEIVARCTSPGEQIFLARSAGSGTPSGNISAAITLSTQYQKFTHTITGQPINTITGIAMRRQLVNSGTVHVKSIIIKE